MSLLNLNFLVKILALYRDKHYTHYLYYVLDSNQLFLAKNNILFMRYPHFTLKKIPNIGFCYF